MSTCLNECASTLPRNIGKNCTPDYRLGGISRLVFIDCSVNFQDITNPDEWCFYAKRGLLVVTGKLQAGKEKSSTKTKLINSCAPEIVIGKTHHVNFIDNNADDVYFSDVLFWNEIITNHQRYKVGYFTCDGLFYGFLDNFTLDVHDIIPNDSQEIAYWEGTIAWFGLTSLVPIAVQNLEQIVLDCIRKFDPEFVATLLPECIGFGIYDLQVINPTSLNNDGQITACITGGTTPYEASINGGAYGTSLQWSGLPAGTYTVNARDADGLCTDTRIVTIENKCAGIAITYKATNVNGASNNGVIKIFVNGGSGKYEYKIDGGEFQPTDLFTGLSAGVHVVSIHDLTYDCTATSNITLTNLCAGLTISAFVATPSGASNDGTVTVTAGGGSGTYAYSIDGINYQANNVISNLAPNVYTVYLRDQTTGCVVTEVNVIVGNSCILFDITGTAIIGTGSYTSVGQVTVTATGGSGTFAYSTDQITWQASNVIGNLGADSYTIYVKDVINGCIKSTIVNIPNICSLLNSTISSVTGSNQSHNGNITFTPATGGTGSYEYSVDSISWQTSNIFTNLAPGSYTGHVRDTNTLCDKVIAVDIIVNDLCSELSIDSPVTVGASSSGNGMLTVQTVGGGSGTYQYSLTGFTYQVSNIFANLSANTYTVFAKDMVSGCVARKNGVIIADLCETLQIVSVIPVGTGPANTGEIIIAIVTGGTEAYEYSINGATYQVSNTFTLLPPNIYTVYVRDTNSGCVKSAQVTVPDICENLTATFDILGSGVNPTGTVAVSSVSNGRGPYAYSIDGGVLTYTPNFTSVSLGAHVMVVSDTATGCTYEKVITVPSICPSLQFYNIITVPSGPLPSGQISSVNVSGGSDNYEYSIDGLAWQATCIFTGLPSGPVLLYVRDLVTNCQTQTTVTIGNACSAFTIGDIIPVGSGILPTGTLTINTCYGGSSNLEYSKDGSVWQVSSTLTGYAPGTYIVYARDVDTGCVAQKSTTVPSICSQLHINNIIPTPSFPSALGKVTIASVIGGSNLYEYSKDSITWQVSEELLNFNPGNYTVYARDTTTQCVTSSAITVVDGCLGITIGTPNIQGAGVLPIGVITITSVTGGSGDYEYSKDTLVWQPSPSLTGYAVGTYTVYARDINRGCIAEKSVVVPSVCPMLILGTPTVANTSTPLATDGSITVLNVTGGSTNYEYSTNFTVWQPSPALTGLGVGNYTVYVRDIESGCVATKSNVNIYSN